MFVSVIPWMVYDTEGIRGMLQRDRCVLLKCFAYVCINVTPWMVYDTEGIRGMLQRDRCVLLKCFAYVCISGLRY
jgi:hypothetical protein